MFLYSATEKKTCRVATQKINVRLQKASHE